MATVSSKDISILHSVVKPASNVPSFPSYVCTSMKAAKVAIENAHNYSGVLSGTASPTQVLERCNGHCEQRGSEDISILCSVMKPASCV